MAFIDADDMSVVNEVMEDRADQMAGTAYGELLQDKMFFDEDVPVSVAINEAVELGKRFGTDDSSSFINGILGKLAKKADA